MVDIPLGLRTSLESGKCVLFLGAGVGQNLFDQEGNTAPCAADLAQELASHFSIDSQESTDLAKVSKIVELRKGRSELEIFLQKRFADLEPDEHFQWLFSRRWQAIYTTNYDRGIQRAYELNPTPPQKPVTVTITSDIRSHDPLFEVPIYHLHGTLFGSAKPKIIITDDDYSNFKEHRKMLFELLTYHFATSSILCPGSAGIGESPVFS